MKSSGNDKVYDDASELVQVADLEGVRFFALEARIKDDTDFHDNTVAARAESPSATDDENQRWTFFIQVDREALNLRARLELNAPDAAYTVDAAVFFFISEPGEVPKNVASEFVNRVAILALYPFIREALHELARKIDARQPLLGLYHPGDLRINLDDAEELS